MARPLNSGARRRPEDLGRQFSPANPTMMDAPPLFGSAPPSNPFDLFDDPSTKLLTDTIRDQMNFYRQPAGMDPNTAGVLDYFKSQMSGGPQIAGNPLLGDFITEGRKRIAELNEEPFSASEEAALKTRTTDRLTRDRDSQRKLAEQDIARRGMADSSGLLQERLMDVDRGYTAANTEAARDLMLYIADQRQQRKNQATTIAGQLSSAGQADAQMRNAASEAASGRIMSAASAIANIAAQQRGEARANQQQVLNLAAMMAQLPMDRLNQVMGLLNGMGGGPAGLNSQFSNTLALSNQQTAQRNAQDSAHDDFMEQMSKLATYFANRGRS